MPQGPARGLARFERAQGIAPLDFTYITFSLVFTAGWRTTRDAFAAATATQDLR